MTRNFWLLSGLIFGLIFVGLFSTNNIPILLSLPLLVYLGFAISNIPPDPLLEVDRALSTYDSSLGKPIDVKVKVVNNGKSLEELFLTDSIRGSSILDINKGVLSKRLPLGKGDIVDIHYTVSGRRGRYVFEGMNVQNCDYFGLFQNESFLPARAQLAIFPEITQLRSIKIRPRQTRGFAGPILARQAGAGTDFYGVREYQSGDPLRRINWKISSRYQQTLFTNESEQERIADVGLILDARQQSDIATQAGTLFEYSVNATGSLADAFLRDGHRVGLYIYGYSVERVFPGYGKIQRENILKSLSRAHTGINFALENLNFLSTRFFPPKTQLVMISPLKPDDLTPLVRLHSTGYELMIVSPNPIHFEAQKYNPAKNPDLDLAFRLSLIERALMLKKLRRAGIQVIDWQVDLSLDQVLYQAVRRHPAGDRILQIGL